MRPEPTAALCSPRTGLCDQHEVIYPRLGRLHSAARWHDGSTVHVWRGSTSHYASVQERTKSWHGERTPCSRITATNLLQLESSPSPSPSQPPQAAASRTRSETNGKEGSGASTISRRKSSLKSVRALHTINDTGRPGKGSGRAPCTTNIPEALQKVLTKQSLP